MEKSLSSPIPKLNKEQKHTIKVIIDYVRPQKPLKKAHRQLRSCLKISDGFIEVLESNSVGELDTQNKSNFSLKKGCPKCGFSWPKLDSRFFSANSVGRCSTCSGIGTLKSEEGGALAAQCKTCEGTGISQKYKTIFFHKMNIHKLYQTPLEDLLKTMEASKPENPAQKILFEEITRIFVGW